MTLSITPALIGEMLADAIAASPREACGILLGKGEAITAIAPARNVHSSPETHFEIDPQALVDAHRAAREGGPQVIGYYHSHPCGPVRPSTTDQAQAARDALIWAIIVPPSDVTFWRDDERGFIALPSAAYDR